MEFFCEDQEAWVRATFVEAARHSLQAVSTISKQIFLRHTPQRRDFAEGAYVPMQTWLNALAEINSVVGGGSVRQIGRRVGETCVLPEGDLDAVLMALPEVQRRNHLGGVGRYETSRLEDGSVVIECYTPYPRPFEMGLVEGIVRRLSRAGAPTYTVSFGTGPAGPEVSCTLTVRPAVALVA